MNTKRLLFIINVCLSGAVLWTAFYIVVTWISSHSGKVPAKVSLVSAAGTMKHASDRTKKMEDYRDIIAHDIFKTAREAPPVRERPAPKKKPLRLADLNLKLKGTVVGGQEDSYAVIFDGTKRKEDLYYLNGVIRGAHIVRILPDRVVFDLNGKRESLMMMIDEGISSNTMNRRENRAPKKEKSRKSLPLHAGGLKK